MVDESTDCEEVDDDGDDDDDFATEADTMIDVLYEDCSDEDIKHLAGTIINLSCLNVKLYFLFVTLIF